MRTVLSYPQVGEVPVFTPGFVYIPRRAVVAHARKPEAGAEAYYSEADLALTRTITRLFQSTPGDILARVRDSEQVRRHWFREDGSWWGISPAHRERWLEWAEAVP
ncbi:MAG TPA: hypothetical protein VGR37_00025 [Longimicrobiaceae bacterium]|nr:hypothetical protein [Longimicrobiaceae bacterium]